MTSHDRGIKRCLTDSARYVAGIVVLAILLFSGLQVAVATQSNSESVYHDLQSVPTGTTDPNYSVITWTPSKTWNGTTVFGNSLTHQIVELNMLGQVVWRYTIPFTGPSMIIGGVMAVPGSNNVLYTVGEPESMRGAYEVNRQGQLVWSFINKTISHDAVRLPNGDTLLTAAHSEDYGNWPYTYPEVFEVNPRGQVVWQWHANQDYANNSRYANIRSTDFGYWTHVNEALRLPDGTTMISVRNFNLTIIVDQSGKVQRAFDDPCDQTCGPSGYIPQPHSPIPLPNGNYLTNSPGIGRVYEFNPNTRSAVWQWPPPGVRSTVYNLRGSQRLPNGNTLICDSGGQLIEVTPDYGVVWAVKYAGYVNSTSPIGVPFFQAERLSYMPPGFTVSSPAQRSTYSTKTVPLTAAAGTDLGNLTYSVRNNQNGTWIVKNATLIQDVYKDSLDAPTVTKGPSSLSLANGNYTMRFFASSTGYGYKAFVQQKRINYASQDITFSVNAPTVTSTTTSSQTTAATSSTTSTAKTTTSTSTATTASSSTAATQSSSATTSITANVTTTSTTTTIPEFPLSLVTVFVGSLLVAVAVLSRFGGRLPR